MAELTYLRKADHSSDDHEHDNCPCLSIAQYLSASEYKSEEIALAPATDTNATEQVSSLFDADQISYLHQIDQDPDATFAPTPRQEGSAFAELDGEIFGNFKDVAEQALARRRASELQRRRAVCRRRRLPDFLLTKGNAESGADHTIFCQRHNDESQEPVEPFAKLEEIKNSGGSDLTLDERNLLKILAACAGAFALITWTLLIVSSCIKHNLSDPQASCQSAPNRSLYVGSAPAYIGYQDTIASEPPQPAFRTGPNLGVYLPPSPLLSQPAISAPAPAPATAGLGYASEVDGAAKSSCDPLCWCAAALIVIMLGWHLLQNLSTARALMLFLVEWVCSKLKLSAGKSTSRH